MYAISIWQPWASLIAEGVKVQETRSWAAPQHLIGKRIAIHAAKRKLTKAELRELPGMIHHDISARYGRFWEEDVPYGAIIATAELFGVAKITGESKGWGLEGWRIDKASAVTIFGDIYGDYSIGRYVWGLQHITKKRDPVPERGQQGFWNWKEPK